MDPALYDSVSPYTDPAETPTATEMPTAAHPKPPTEAARLRNGVWTWGDDDDEVD